MGKKRSKIIVGLALVIGLLAFAIGQEQKQEPEPPVIAQPPAMNRGAPVVKPAKDDVVRLVMSPDDTLNDVALDLSSIDPISRQYIRYLWVKVDDPEEFQEDQATLNMISRASTLQFATPVGKGRLIRVDLRQYCPQNPQDWIDDWEKLAFDPSFSLLVTKGTVNNVVNNKEMLKSLEKEDVLRFNSRAIRAELLIEIQKATHSEDPIVADQYFRRRVHDTIKDKGVFKQVWGGLYYEFRGIRKSKQEPGKAKVTDLELLLSDLGIVDADKLFNRLRSDQRVAIFVSKVTGKPREVDLFRTPAGKETTGWIAITRDLRDQDVDVDTHPILNLIKTKVAAFELIAEGPNGCLIFAIFDGEGNLLDEAAAEVVVDRTIPNPYPTRLRGSYGCVNCHSFADGWQPMDNDAKTLINAGLVPFTDLTDLTKTVVDVDDRIKGLFTGSFDKQLTRARDDYAETLLKASLGVNGLPGWASDPGQVHSVRVVSQGIVKGFNKYAYSPVSPDDACEDLGLHPPTGQGAKIFAALVPQTDPEDARIGALRLGISIPRTDWDLVRDFAAVRAQQNLFQIGGLK